MIGPSRTHVLVAVALAGLLTACGGSPDAATRASTVAPSATSATEASSTVDAATFDTAGLSQFPVRMELALPTDWKALTDVPAAIDLVHVGTPPEDTSQWWGAVVVNVDGASVHAPGSVVTPGSASPNRKDFVPWPDDFFAYVTAIPGVTVRSGPEPITVGGIIGSRLIVETPAMHPLVWTATDSMWLGGGRNGVDPAFTRFYALVEANGHRMLFEYDDFADQFDARLPAVTGLFDNIRFPGV